jgi:hypothetical protein
MLDPKMLRTVALLVAIPAGIASVFLDCFAIKENRKEKGTLFGTAEAVPFRSVPYRHPFDCAQDRL